MIQFLTEQLGYTVLVLLAFYTISRLIRANEIVVEDEPAPPSLEIPAPYSWMGKHRQKEMKGETK